MIEGTGDLLVDRDGAVVTVTINRPQVMNAMTPQMFVDFGRVCRSVNGDETVRVLVLTGAGGNFCSGADVSGQADRVSGDTPVVPLRNMRRIKEAAMALHDVQHPVVAKVRGVAAGAGLNIALGCDLVYASDQARFSEIFARRGLSLDFGGSWLLPRRVGLHRAKELALLAEVIDAQEADRIGLVNRVLPDGELDAHVDDVVSRIAAGPPLALSMSKELLNSGSVSSMGQALEAEGLAQSVNLATSDIREAGQAWVEKRHARFEGH
ncbi:MAG: enoyl-CoA hydratase [Acidimicrobiales bacterium]|jgi:2-(1,2-epoxy-1,2-dihydrophenyl)acetyl-CoA isomerase|nr:enoyl-CoA hydratase [Actinomycetota bacterium]MDP6062912.1 enoyl-CoA hydratase [Acidimicrobiales bacterium]MDP6214356.1 enoyl-CoA hydratase [Acidimicrobiales bacterium]MDP7208976.1 enoyl-CoA hydratase [Acidimicrobiales bacterium]|tara:strand:- start:26223 stop:27020 length:798 start_codon:yes stop_codon:yes gene_type:complete